MDTTDLHEANLELQEAKLDHHKTKFELPVNTSELHNYTLLSNVRTPRKKIGAQRAKGLEKSFLYDFFKKIKRILENGFFKGTWELSIDKTEHRGPNLELRGVYSKCCKTNLELPGKNSELH